MENTLLQIDGKKEAEKIIAFLQNTFIKQGIQTVVVGTSGGIDSVTTFYLLKHAVSAQYIFPAHLPYFSPSNEVKKLIEQIGIPKENFYDLSIKDAVDSCIDSLGVDRKDKVRVGNIMARVRMIFLYDFAKKHKSLVVGTENKSEHLLGYFTRFGDEASDIEPLKHLYKTQVYQLATYLGVPKEIITQAPTAGLWEGQTDEDEFGFTYQEADKVLYYYFDQKLPVEKIEQMGFSNTKKIIQRVKENEYKHKTPYILEI